MVKYKVLIVAIIVLLIGGVSIGVGDFFFTNQYYLSPLDAFNKNYSFDPIEGECSIESEIKRVKIDDDNIIFLGQTTQNQIIVLPMRTKGNEYSCKGDNNRWELDASYSDVFKEIDFTSIGYDVNKSFVYSIVYKTVDVSEFLNNVNYQTIDFVIDQCDFTLIYKME